MAISNRICSVNGCNNSQYSRGYCERHYRRLIKYGDPTGCPPKFQKPKCSVAVCTKTAECAGYCKAHYSRLKRHGDPLGGRNTTSIAVAWIEEHVAYSDDSCLIYPFRRRWNGYGEVLFRGNRTAANRVMCTLAHGDAPTPTHHAAHSCGNGFGGCVNPRHLYWATKKENERDKRSHGTLPLGEKHSQSKLTSNDVRRIRQIGRTMPLERTAETFGVCRQTVANILARKVWAWLE